MKNIFISIGPKKKVYVSAKGPTKWLRHLGGYNGKKGGAPTVTQKNHRMFGDRCSRICSMGGDRKETRILMITPKT